MSKSSSSSVRHRRTGLVIVVAAVVVLVLLSAFVWPHWAVNDPAPQAPPSSKTAAPPSHPASKEAAKPKATPKPLPQDATDLLKSMPDTVGDFARTKADPAREWAANTPIEEYDLTYSTGDQTKDVSLHAAQWATSDDAKKLYDAATWPMTGKEIASGNVKTSGNKTGTYVEKEDPADPKKAIVIWQNDTVVFRAQGQKAALETFYRAFPL
ncbi:hypothetical protein [Bifidobacterium favimelis]|uniref:Secreted protein n=1 Tax=Bifidobacterium favimelis TaxID=3122979 RepID=A0ABU8ZP73_9BIFI